jgi:hypothetical protein
MYEIKYRSIFDNQDLDLFYDGFDPIGANYDQAMQIIHNIYNTLPRKHSDIDHQVLRQSMKTINELFGRHHYLIEDESNGATRKIKYAYQSYHKYNSTYEHITDNPELRGILKESIVRLCRKIQNCLDKQNVLVMI